VRLAGALIHVAADSAVPGQAGRTSDPQLQREEVLTAKELLAADRANNLAGHVGTAATPVHSDGPGKCRGAGSATKQLGPPERAVV
jgi:hypothetical protein